MQRAPSPARQVIWFPDCQPEKPRRSVTGLRQRAHNHLGLDAKTIRLPQDMFKLRHWYKTVHRGSLAMCIESLLLHVLHTAPSLSSPGSCTGRCTSSAAGLPALLHASGMGCACLPDASALTPPRQPGTRPAPRAWHMIICISCIRMVPLSCCYSSHDYLETNHDQVFRRVCYLSVMVLASGGVQ